MKNATPKVKELDIPKNKEERLKILNILNLNYLEDTLRFLLQLKRAGIGDYYITENEIIGFENHEITKIMTDINFIYLSNYNFQNKINKNRKIDNDFFMGNRMGHTVFSQGKLEAQKISVSGKRYLERTFRVEQNYDLAVEELKEVIENRKRKNLSFKKINEPIKIEKLSREIQEDGFYGKSGNKLANIQPLEYKIIRLLYENMPETLSSNIISEKLETSKKSIETRISNINKNFSKACNLPKRKIITGTLSKGYCVDEKYVKPPK